MTVSIVCVLRSGGGFRPRHVARLRRQLEKALPGAEMQCLTDLPLKGGNTLPLRHGWPGWWSKMEAFSPELRGDVLLMDLDSALVGDLSEIASAGRLTMMRDVYRPDGLQSSLMYLPEADRAEAWAAWIADPEGHMRRHRAGGDQAFLETLWLDRAARWQDTHPGQVVSYKADIQRAGTPLGNQRFVAFHGRPRPWEVGW